MKLGQGNFFITSTLFLMKVIFKARINITNTLSQYSFNASIFLPFFSSEQENLLRGISTKNGWKEIPMVDCWDV